MNTRGLEIKIQDAIESAIFDYEIDNGEITNIEIDANVIISPDGDSYMVNVYECE